MALEFIGNGIFFTIGVIFGAAIMYFGPIIIEILEEVKGEKKCKH